MRKKLDERIAVLRSVLSSPDDADSDDNHDDGDREYQVDSNQRMQYSDGDGSEDSNSPMPYFDPADYVDEPVTDEDICE